MCKMHTHTHTHTQDAHTHTHTLYRLIGAKDNVAWEPKYSEKCLEFAFEGRESSLMSWGRLFQMSVCVRCENTEEGLYESVLLISLLEKTQEGRYE